MMTLVAHVGQLKDPLIGELQHNVKSQSQAKINGITQGVMVKENIGWKEKGKNPSPANIM